MQAVDTRKQVDFEQIVRLSPIGMCVLDRQLRYVFCNEALADINGLPVEAHFGRSVAELLPELAPHVVEAFMRAFDRPAETYERKVRGATPKFPHVERVWLERIRPLGEDGRASHLLVTVVEITELERAEEALRISERTFRVSQQLSPDGFVILKGTREQGDLVDFRIDYANPKIERIARVDGLTGRSLLTLFPGAREVFDWLVEALGDHDGQQTEILFEEGLVSGWFRLSAVLIDEDKLAVGVSDITRRKAAEERLIVTNREFQHRLQNVLTVVSALVMYSAKSAQDTAQLGHDIIRRIAALGEAQKLLNVEPTSTPVRTIVDSALKPFALPNLQIHGGPDLVVESEMVVHLTLALNELATNAVKYGGLSGADAKTELRWSVEEQRVHLHWVETTGGANTATGRQGFGTELLKRTVSSLPDGRLEIEHREAGLRAHISFAA